MTGRYRRPGAFAQLTVPSAAAVLRNMYHLPATLGTESTIRGIAIFEQLSSHLQYTL